MTLRDPHGRPLHELDILRLRLAAQDLLARQGHQEEGYSICAEDGAPICGYVPHTGRVNRMTAIGWRTA